MTEPEEVEVWWPQPGPHADAIFHALQKALEAYSKEQEVRGLMPTLSDPISALISMLGLVIGSVDDDEQRTAMYRGCGLMLRVSIDKARETGATRHVQIIKVSKGTGTMQ